MAAPGLIISRIQSVPGLERAWRETGEKSPAAAELWMESVREGKNTLLAGHIGTRIVAMAGVRWIGSEDPTVRATVATHYPEADIIPFMHSLRTRKAFRRQGIARSMVAAIHRQVKNMPGAAQVIALTVEADNSEAVSLYKNEDYKILSIEGQDSVILRIPKFNDETGKFDAVESRMYIMAKDLSEEEDA